MSIPKRDNRWFDAANVVVLVMLAFMCVYPMLHVLFASFSDPGLLARHRGFMIRPQGFTTKGYRLVFANPNIMNGYLNTLFYVIVGTVVNLLMTSLGAYVLSRKKVLLGPTMMFLIVFTMFFSGGLIPFYLVVKGLGMVNRRIALIVPQAIWTWNLIVMRTSFKGIPDSLEESARMDGANDYVILFRIILPISQAVLAVMTLFYGVGRWNEWFNAMIFLRRRELYPLQLILREILISQDTNSMTKVTTVDQVNLDVYRTLVQYSTIIVATGPILFLYPFLQKHFVKGVLIGSLKG